MLAHRLARAVCLIDAERDRLFPADHAEARRLRDHHLAVALGPRAGYEAVQRPTDAGARRILRDVMNLAVGDHDGAGEALRRNVGERPVQRLEGARAVILRADAGLYFDGAEFGIGQPSDSRLQCLPGLGGPRCAASTFLAEGPVDHRDGDVGQSFALLVTDGRVGECSKEDGERNGAEQGAARARQGEGRDQGDAKRAQDGQHRPGQNRVEGDAPAVHCPSLSRRAGTCTWSAL